MVTYHVAQIRKLARECKQDALARTPPGGVICDVAEYFERLEQMLGRPYADDEAYAFRMFFETAATGFPA